MLKIAKFFIIIIIGVAICLFGFHFGPKKEYAEAKVFERLLSYTKSMRKYLFDDEVTSKPRKVIVNNEVQGSWRI